MSTEVEYEYKYDELGRLICATYFGKCSVTTTSYDCGDLAVLEEAPEVPCRSRRTRRAEQDQQ